MDNVRHYARGHGSYRSHVGQRTAFFRDALVPQRGYTAIVFFEWQRTWETTGQYFTGD